MLLSIIVCTSSFSSEKEGGQNQQNVKLQAIDPDLVTLNHIIDRAEDYDTKGLILAFRALDDTTRLKMAQDACAHLRAYPLDKEGRLSRKTYHIPSIGKAMLATHKDLPSLYTFVLSIIETKHTTRYGDFHTFCSDVWTFLSIALQRFQTKIYWNDYPNSATLLIEPQFEDFMKRSVKCMAASDLAPCFEHLISIAAERYCFKCQSSAFPVSLKEKYWNLYQSWFEDRKREFDEGIILGLYKMLIKEKIIKRPRIKHAKQRFIHFYKTMIKYETMTEEEHLKADDEIFYITDTYSTISNLEHFLEDQLKLAKAAKEKQRVL